MKRVFVIVMVLAIVGVLVACKTEDSEPTPTVVPTAKAVELEVVETAKSNENLSYTTGLPFEGVYQPVIVVIENSAAARPQTGLQTADVVYEVPVESSITRFVCVFSDHVPSEVMPVRSARVPFLYIQHEWDAIFMHYGGSAYKYQDEPHSVYGHDLYSDIRIAIDGWRGWNDYFFRVKDIKAPHNVMGNPLLAQALYDYSPKPLSWQFDSNVVYSGENVSEISLNMCSTDDNFISYKYDAENDTYLRFMNGKEFVSAETEQQVSAKNIIVQYSTYTVYKDIKLWEMVGSGKADIYIDGNLMKGTWERQSISDETVYFDDARNQIVFKPGNTWIHIHPIE